MIKWQVKGLKMSYMTKINNLFKVMEFFNSKSILHFPNLAIIFSLKASKVPILILILNLTMPSCIFFNLTTCRLTHIFFNSSLILKFLALIYDFYYKQIQHQQKISQKADEYF